MKKLATLIALAALAAGCTATDNANTGTGNTNVAAVVPNNANNANNANAANTNTANATRRTYNPNITEAEYEKDKARYSTEAKDAGDTIGSGLKDGWLWTKTKGSLAAVDDLRDSTINVDVDNGVITLRGTVASAAQKAAAVKAANGIEGKTSVKDQLKVAADGSATNANAGNANAAHNANAKH
ncbi:MAG TPA: BON domain-containing protein [Pyrinomonadaceae bacterium]|jgi:hypothetical protein|nr:BON domain-containing protein [Pyrinomonadaceae bacterium]